MTAPLRSLVLDAPTVTCACCKDRLYPDEFGQAFYPDFQAKVNALYSGPVCDNCTDEHATCPECGRMHHTTDREAQSVSTGETVCSPRCRDEFEADLREGEWG